MVEDLLFFKAVSLLFKAVSLLFKAGSLLFKNGNIRQVAVMLVVVQAKSHNKLIRDCEAGVLHFKRWTFNTIFDQQCGELKTCRVTHTEVLHEIVQRETRIDDVFNNEHMLACNLGIEILEDSNDTRGLGGGSV